MKEAEEWDWKILWIEIEEAAEAEQKEEDRNLFMCALREYDHGFPSVS